MIESLAYLVVRTPHMDAWMDLARTHIGFQTEVLPAGAGVRLRMDDRCQRLLLLPTDQAPALSMGLSVADGQALQALRARLQGEGHTCRSGTPQEIALRAVEDMLVFQDPDGNQVEVAHGLRPAATSFTPGRPLGGFRTGELGLGHVALIAANYPAMAHLYKELLGFRLSDYASVPFKAEFLHVNPRHHSLALIDIDIDAPAAVHHVMVEYRDLDDVGRAYDMAQERPESVGVTLGRHSNDHVISFYLKTPDSWMLELGWAGCTIGENWQAEELPGPSLWGHDRYWLPEAKRQEARQLLKNIAAQGIRAPVAVQAQAAAEGGVAMGGKQ